MGTGCPFCRAHRTRYWRWAAQRSRDQCPLDLGNRRPDGFPLTIHVPRRLANGQPGHRPGRGPASSPPQRILRFDGPFQPASMSRSAMSSASPASWWHGCSPASRQQSVAISRLGPGGDDHAAPTHRAGRASSTAISNASVVTARRISLAFRPGRVAMAHSKLDRGLVLNLDTLGFSVEPDVKMT